MNFYRISMNFSHEERRGLDLREMQFGG